MRDHGLRFDDNRVIELESLRFKRGQQRHAAGETVVANVANLQPGAFERSADRSYRLGGCNHCDRPFPVGAPMDFSLDRCKPVLIGGFH